MRQRSQRGALFGMLAAAPVVLGACGGALFACENADECAGAGAGARCEPDGWCSVDDAACPSGRRYGEHSGDGKGGACVDDGGTSSTATTAPPPTSSTLDPVTTLDPPTSSTTLDPTMATLESTSASETDTTTSGDASSGEVTTDPPQPVCGDAIVEGQEDCDGGVQPGTGCEDLGWTSGSLSCLDDCSYDTSACLGCGPDGCSFEPCSTNDPRGCPAGETCFEALNGGMCTAACDADDDCSHPRLQTVCYMSQAVMGVCLLSCENQGCPAGMTCAPIDPPVCVFL